MIEPAPTGSRTPSPTPTPTPTRAPIPMPAPMPDPVLSDPDPVLSDPDPTADARTLDDLWTAVLDRDPRFDGLLFYGVRSTGIYCRPSCPSRRPKRQNVAFFATPGAAESAGLRACKRCRPSQPRTDDPDTRLVLDACAAIEAAIDAAIEADGDLAPSMADLARSVGSSERRVRQVFERLLGVSPARYAQALRVGRLRASLRAGASVTDAIYQAGFGSPSRVYESSHRQLGMTPATYRKGGAGARVGWALAKSEVGYLLVAGTERGLSSVRIGDDPDALRLELETELHAAERVADAPWVAPWLRALGDYLAGTSAWPALPVDLRATAFQAKVWNALRQIPEGTVWTYAELAAAIDQPKAARAVGRACATNPVALAVPCHRVVASDGNLRGYRWGMEVKRRLLDLESRR